jgi:hypothetical protein
VNQALGFRGALADPGLAGLYDLWVRLGRELGRLPYRQEIDPLDLPPHVLPTMLVLEREASGRFHCRLAGTAMAEYFGFDPTGAYLDEVMPPEAARVRARLYERVLDERRPVVCRFKFAVPGREFIANDRLYVPALGTAPDHPSVLFSAQRFLTSAEVVGQPDRNGVYHVRFDDSPPA